MKTHLTASPLLLALALLAAAGACAQKQSEITVSTKPGKHGHQPPHGGTPVALGDELYQIELVRDVGTAKLQAYLFDGEFENFIRSSAPSFEIIAVVNGAPQTLVFHPVANPATGEMVGDTSLFEAEAAWLKTTKEFDAILPSITIRGTTFTNVKFNFPGSNDSD